MRASRGARQPFFLGICISYWDELGSGFKRTEKETNKYKGKAHSQSVCIWIIPSSQFDFFFFFCHGDGGVKCKEIFIGWSCWFCESVMRLMRGHCGTIFAAFLGFGVIKKNWAKRCFCWLIHPQALMLLKRACRVACCCCHESDALVLIPK